MWSWFHTFKTVLLNNLFPQRSFNFLPPVAFFTSPYPSHLKNELRLGTGWSRWRNKNCFSCFPTKMWSSTFIHALKYINRSQEKEIIVLSFSGQERHKCIAHVILPEFHTEECTHTTYLGTGEGRLETQYQVYHG